MIDPLKWLASFLPRDDSDDAGFFIFRLPKEHPFNRAAKNHDYRYDHPDEQSRSAADIELFSAWHLTAMAEPDPIKRCHLLSDICTFWPIARSAGFYLYGRYGTYEEPALIDSEQTKFKETLEDEKNG